MSYSRVTKKGQVTIPIKYRRKYDLGEGVVVVFEEAGQGLVIRPMPDIADSAGVLSEYGRPEELLAELIKAREESFR